MFRLASPYPLIAGALTAMGAVFATFFVINQTHYDAVIVADAIIAVVLVGAAGLTLLRRRWATALGGAVGLFMAVALVVEPFSRYRLLHPGGVPVEFALTVLALLCGVAAATAAIEATVGRRRQRGPQRNSAA